MLRFTLSILAVVFIVKSKQFAATSTDKTCENLSPSVNKSTCIPAGLKDGVHICTSSQICYFDASDPKEQYHCCDVQKDRVCEKGFCFQKPDKENVCVELCPELPATRNPETAFEPAINFQCSSGICYTYKGEQNCYLNLSPCPELPKTVRKATQTGPAIDGDCKNGLCFRVDDTDSCFPCVDASISFCKGWKQNGFCDDSLFYSSADRRAYCPKTCGICKTGSP
ncbi:unnamed protein product, partial [Mesorhabditis belari]|uniref:ShKT domain-containing protein n=1 Tax=Mesorhabditis belari TaxID=2138241 RepID=A0AAF3ENK1_9BILA